MRDRISLFFDGYGSETIYHRTFLLQCKLRENFVEKQKLTDQDVCSLGEEHLKPGAEKPIQILDEFA